jgi:hypothetical protein
VNKSILYILGVFIGLYCHAQFKIYPLNQQKQKQTTQLKTSLSLPFWEDFSTSESTTPDTLRWVNGSDVFINATLGQNPPSYKVATFDGLKLNGLAHDIASGFNGAGDSLVSQQIDLLNVAMEKRSTTFLSFYWQAKGNGEIPDKNDSLVLYFNRLSDDINDNSTPVWDIKWSQIGGEENVSEQFEQVLIPLDSPSYFFDNFQFKFVSYSSQKGPFDTWHLDYIYLNENRSRSDVSHFDRTLSGSPSLLFSPYFEIPSEHFFTNPTRNLTQQSVLAVNLDGATAVGHPLEYFYTLRDLTNQVTLDSINLGNGGQGGLKPLEYRSITSPETFNISTPPNQSDSLVLESSFYYLTNDKFLFEEVNGTDTVFLPVDLSINDEIKTQYLLQDHYAYDDGSAEFAVAINLLRGQVAVKFVLDQPDTLTHLDIYFPSIAPESAGSSVDLMVWDQLQDSRLRRRQTYTIKAPDGLNAFERIKLNSPVFTRDSIYIGYQQFTDNYIGIGFDRNNPLASENIYTNVDGAWVQNTRLKGAIMIRPVFGADTAFSLLPVKPLLKELHVFPNPTDGIISIDGDYRSLNIYNLSGELVYKAAYMESHNLSTLKNGIYLIKFGHPNKITTQKLIIQK